MNVLDGIDAVLLDIGGTLVAEAAPGTAVADLVVTCLPHVVEDLRSLRTSVRLGAATNTAVMTEVDVRALLRPTGLDDLLEVVVTSCDVGVAKPDPKVLLVALDRLGVAPGRALFVGDDPVDEAAAVAAGIAFAPAHPDGVLAAIERWAAGDAPTWPRPVPLIGDTTSATERAAEPDGWRLTDDERDGLYAAIHRRRDVRRYRADAVPEDVLRRVLAAGHAAPSVGHSQPWRFVLVRDPATRDRAALLADHERLVQAEALEPEAARHLLDLQLEGIREAPLGVVVCCDRRTPAAGVLGRRTFADADLWSCACAIQNLWLAARAEGLGVGWVTLFEPTELAALVDLPGGVEPLGWLCVGWPDERNPDPGLERAGWSARLALDDVVLHERWHEGGEPAPPVSKLRGPDQAAVVGARDQADGLLTPLGSLGVLDRVADRLLALGHSRLATGTLLLAVGRHRVVELGVSAFDASVTEDVLDAARAGRALGVVAAAQAGLDVEVVDAGTATGNLRDADALTAAATDELVARGEALGRTLGQRGLVALGEVGMGNTTVAAALAAALLGLGPDEVVGLGAGADSAMLERKRAVVAAALDRTSGVHDDPLALIDPLALLAALGGPELALLTGATLGAAAVGAPVVLDGLATSVAALVAVRTQPGVAAHLVAGQRSREPGHGPVLSELGLEALLDLRLRAGEGAGACLASSLLLQALRIRAETARTD